MKKVGLVVFIVTLSVGYIVARSFGFTGPGFNISFSKKIHESGVIANEKRHVGDFDSIEAGGAITVEVVSQKDFDVVVEADENILPHIKTEVDGDTLKIYRKGRFSFHGNSRIVVRIAMPEVKRVDLSGASSANVSNIKAETLDLQCSGASKVFVTGEVKDLRSEINGASKIDAEGLKAENVWIEANGASKMSVFVTGDLKVDANGASSIGYLGEPVNLSKDISGASSVYRK